MIGDRRKEMCRPVQMRGKNLCEYFHENIYENKLECLFLK